jgi:hypothetical protein
MHLASYSDASVLPLLHAAFDRHPIVRGEVFANQALIELEAAIEDLGGELTPAQKDKVGVALEREEELVGQVQCPIEDAFETKPSTSRERHHRLSRTGASVEGRLDRARDRCDYAHATRVSSQGDTLDAEWRLQLRRRPGRAEDSHRFGPSDGGRPLVLWQGATRGRGRILVRERRDSAELVRCVAGKGRGPSCCLDEGRRGPKPMVRRGLPGGL